MISEKLLCLEDTEKNVILHEYYLMLHVIRCFTRTAKNEYFQLERKNPILFSWID